MRSITSPNSSLVVGSIQWASSHREHRPAAGEADHLVEQGLECSGLLRLRGQVDGWIASLGRDRQQRREQGRDVGDVPGRLREHRLQLVKPGLGGIIGDEPRCPLELVHHRVKRAVGVIGRAVVAQADIRFLGQALDQATGQARLADPGLA
jgi:hypothetical protein